MAWAGDSRSSFAAGLYQVLRSCEHRRRALAGDDAEARLREAAENELDSIERSERGAGASPSYWQALRDEVLGTALPQYLPAALRQNELERSGYGVWRQGDLLARAVFALAGLTIGGIIIAVPFIPIFEEAFAFLLALAGFLYPELRRLGCDRQHARLLNRLLREAAMFQASRQRALSEAALHEALEPLPGEPPAPHRT